MFSNLLQDALDQQFTLHPGTPLNLGWPWKSMKFQAISNTLKIIYLLSQDLLKVTKMKSKQIPEIKSDMMSDKRR